VAAERQVRWTASVPESLSTIAEIGIGLAGFAGVVVALGNRSHRLDPLDRMRVIGMLVGSLGAALLATLPKILADIGVAEQTTWRTSSAVFACYLSMFLVYSFLASRALPPSLRAHLHLGMWILVIGGTLVFAVVLGDNTLGLSGAPSAGPYLSGLYFLLVYSSIQFLRLLLVRPINLPAA
jgi:hypothetical protein